MKFRHFLGLLGLVTWRTIWVTIGPVLEGGCLWTPSQLGRTPAEVCSQVTCASKACSHKGLTVRGKTMLEDKYHP